MAKQKDFDFDTESKAKFSLDFSFLKNLTQKQKELILMIAIAVVAVIVIVVIGVVVLTGGNNTGGNNIGSNAGGSSEGGDDGGNTEEGDSTTPEIPENVKDFYIASPPNKLSYYVGDEPNFTGLSVFIRGEGNNILTLYYTEAPGEFMITGFDSSAPVAEQTITVECSGFTDTFTIEIKEAPLAKPTLESIRLDPAPRDTAKAGVALSVKDAKIVCVYSDGSEKSIKLTHSHLYGYENELMNAQVGDVITVYVRYTEDGYIAETSYTVTIIE